MPRKGDPENKVREGLYVDDDRKSIIEKNDDGTTSFHRHYGGEWHEHRTGGRDSSDDADDE
jgi:hypothetical protein